MTAIAEATRHEAFRIESEGDLLIVTPVGDISQFSPSIFESEYIRVRKAVSSGDYRNLLVDLSNAGYFGSEMIGRFMDLRQAIAAVHARDQQNDSQAGQFSHVDETGDQLIGGNIEAGGVMALCGLSQDMAAGLQIMSIDKLVLTFDNRQKAVSKLAHITMSERVKQAGSSRPTRLLVLAALVVAAIVAVGPATTFLRRVSAEDGYRQLVTAYADWSRQRAEARTTDAVAKVQRQASSKISSLRRRLDSGEIVDARLEVAKAAQRFDIMMKAPTSETLQRDFAVALQQARDEIKQESGADLAWPEGLPHPHEFRTSFVATDSPASDSSADEIAQTNAVESAKAAKEQDAARSGDSGSAVEQASYDETRSTPQAANSETILPASGLQPTAEDATTQR